MDQYVNLILNQYLLPFREQLQSLSAEGWAIVAAIFFGGLLVGGRIMQFSPGVPLELVRVIEGVIILALAIPELRTVVVRLWTRTGRRKQIDGT